MNSEVIIALIAAAGSSWGAVGTLGWWLSGRFRAVERCDCCDYRET